MIGALIPLIASGIGALAGRGSQKRAEGRAAEAQINTERDRAAADLYRTQVDAALRGRQQELDERTFATKAPGERLSQLLRGSLLSNFQPTNISVPGITPATVTGGGSPALLGPEAREGGNAMMAQALSALMKGEQFSPITFPTAPTLTPLPQSGKLDTFLNVLGGVGSTLGVLDPLFKRKPKPQPPLDSTGGY